MIPFEDRIEIVRACKYVDAAVPQYDMDKLKACKELGATMLFVGDDWYGTEKWENYKDEFAKEGIKIVYFPYTRGVSSTKIPMPRLVDSFFADWKGPTRPEFKSDLDISRYNGNQRWLLWCLEQFLNVIEE